MAHNPNMDYLIKSHIAALELSLTYETFGEEKWERIYKNPQKGLGFFAAELGNPDQLGNALGLFPFVNFPLNPGRKFQLFVRAGDGIGLITKPYNKIKNHKNNINGTYLNEFIYLRIYSRFHIKNARIESGVGLTHLSNGNWAVPNLGINLVTVDLGVSFHKFDTQKAEQPIKKDSALGRSEKKVFTTIVTSGGINENNYRNGKKYGTYALALTEWKPVSPKSRFGIGLDFFYDYSTLAKAKEKGTYDTGKAINTLQAGVRLAYEIVVGKFSLPMEMGSYYFSKSNENGPLYHRVGLRCYPTKHLVLAYTLKTHWFTADNIEFGVGYRF